MDAAAAVPPTVARDHDPPEELSDALVTSGVAALPPSGRVVTESVAALIIDHWYQSNQTAAHKSIIAGMFATSVSVVERIIKAYEESHTVRVPRQGQGRSSDARNFFGVAGASGPANLLRLEAAYGAGKVDDFVADIRSRFLADGFGLNANGAAPDESTLARVLRTTLDYTGKQVSKRARERDEKACDKWISRMTGDYTSDMLVFIDETHENLRTANRKYGRAKRGQRARGTCFFHRGQAYSALSAFSLDGILGSHIVEGGYDAPQFLAGFKAEVLEHLNPYPGPRSVMVLDNCPGLHSQLEMIHLVRSRGARIEWLEPYDPEHNPIELAFRTAKQTLRRERESISYMPRRERLRMALSKVGEEAARSHFRECGYVVP